MGGTPNGPRMRASESASQREEDGYTGAIVWHDWLPRLGISLREKGMATERRSAGLGCQPTPRNHRPDEKGMDTVCWPQGRSPSSSPRNHRPNEKGMDTIEN